jgi:hypothetical protein
MIDKEYEDAIKEKTPLVNVKDSFQKAESSPAQIWPWLALIAAILAFIAWLLWQGVKTLRGPARVRVEQDKAIEVSAQVQSAPSHVMVHQAKPSEVLVHLPKQAPEPVPPVKVATGFARPSAPADEGKA